MLESARSFVMPMIYRYCLGMLTWIMELIDLRGKLHSDGYTVYQEFVCR